MSIAYLVFTVNVICLPCKCIAIGGRVFNDIIQSSPSPSVDRPHE